ncbi:MAG TPA: sigma-70 family RNA polymerase sigma factor [Myxococcota bacterium]|nr:sigma-70 family RNA polymerase sigma factor [Myxococcota bacterium]
MSTPPHHARLDQLYRQHGNAVLRRIRRFFRDPEEAREVLQEVFLRVADKLDTFLGESSPSTWLYQVATRHCINRLRDESRRRELLDQHGLWLGWGAPVTSANQEHTAVLSALWRTANADLIEIGVYYHLDGMTHDEIARVVGCSRRTVGNRLMELQALARGPEEAS